MNEDIVNDCREYAKDPAKWYWRYIKYCSPKSFVYFFKRRTELTDEEFNAIAKAAKAGTLKIKVHA
ncbi:MAG: hypothetical protein JRJ45_00190 [Deltaproteobacteria bacterium]|nr:hypothetical protein [Deltaproteobacteria bacterium]